MIRVLRSAKALLLAYAACQTLLIGSVPAHAQFGGGETAEEKAARAARAEEAERRLTFIKNAKPNWDGFEDLNDLIKGCGSFEDAGIEDELWGFVHFGGPENAAKARNGDRFIQEDAKKAAQGHRAGLAKRHVDGGRKRRRWARVAAVQNDSAQPCSSRSRMGRGVSPVPSPFQREAQECTATWRSGPRFDVRC